jgi:hypothetical protein
MSAAPQRRLGLGIAALAAGTGARAVHGSRPHDPASVAPGWHWLAGSGPDAAPYFRVFTPRLQAQTHDPDRACRHRFVAGLRAGPPRRDALSCFDAVPRAWNLSPSSPRPPPLIEPGPGRGRALAARRTFIATKPPESGARSATLQD